MKKIFLLFVVVLFYNFHSVNAAEKIIFIPLDTRPITFTEIIKVGEKAGAKIITPPDEFLGTEKNPGEPEKLWNWFEKNASDADAAVFSTDALIYGSLVESRKHTLTEEQVQNRVLRFQKLSQNHPRLKLYAYGTILRTLLSMTHSSQGMEPAIYQANATKIYRYSALLDKREMGIATSGEIREFNRLKADIHPEVMEDWANRHAINWEANEKLLDLTKNGVFSFFLLGGDDSAMYSATHREARMLKDYANEKSIDKTKFQILSGSDELGIMMLSRSILDLRSEVPFVHVIYNDGKGKDTLPKYCFDTVGNDIKGELLSLGAIEVPNPARSDFVFMINTKINGKTYEANQPTNTTKANGSTKAFMKKLNHAIDKGYNVVVGDVAYSNGSDNALMEAMRKNNLQFKIKAYGGWNTATNTLGFLLSESVLLNYMTEKSRNELMLRRYLDEWAYQANIRQELWNVYKSAPGEEDPTGRALGTKQAAVEDYATKRMREFAKTNISLPAGISVDNLKVTLPWKRFFECKLTF